ncbi:MAG: hypothetical protein B6I28_03665 [Fusobacteriia bacterium 4572_132]|nr:MAG: hypothetical protein B6I28_03665 [Fusobacteriia bacterium 4572_132]
METCLKTEELIIPEITKIDKTIKELKLRRKTILENSVENKQNFYKTHDFIKKNNYTHSMKEVFKGYEDFVKYIYLAHSTERI